MQATYLCQTYLQALNEGDLAAVLRLFEADGTVLSPLYGRCAVGPFYTDLFADTTRSVTTLKRVYQAEEGHLALEFEYQWTLKNGKVVRFPCVDLFELNRTADKFQHLTIVYDTAGIREEFDKLAR